MERKKSRHCDIVSDRCYRLLRLKRELQNDTRVLKTVVDEVDVLRLCRSLGMTTVGGDIVRSHMFELGLFDPSDYDADFARFIREKIFRCEDAEEQRLSIGCLFGKQSDVDVELVRLGCWGGEYGENLLPGDQGVYCMERGGESEESRQLYVFSWIDAKLFDPENIRDTPAYILRFLLSLSPSITCCVSQEDFLLVEGEVNAASAFSSTRWDSFSVAFRVEKQQEDDRISCKTPTMTTIPDAKGMERAFFVGGMFAALAVEKSAPSTKTWDTRTEPLDSAAFPKWLKELHTHYAVTLPHRQEFPIGLQKRLLAMFERAPGARLRELRSAYNEQMDQNRKEIAGEVSAFASELFESVIRDGDLLFGVEDLSTDALTADAWANYRVLRQSLGECGVLTQLDRKTYGMLNLPDRLQDNMKFLEGIYRHHRSVFRETLDAIVSDTHLPLDNEGSEGVWRAVKGAAHRVVRWVWVDDAPFTDRFRQAMETHQATLQIDWAETIQDVVDKMRNAMIKQRCQAAEKDLHKQLQREKETVSSRAFADLRRFLADTRSRDLCAKISSLRFTKDEAKVSVKWSKEVEKEPSKVISMYELSTSEGKPVETSHLGTMEFEPGYGLLKVATVKTCQLIAILVSEKNTVVRRVQFPPHASAEQTQNEYHEVRGFPRACSLCSIRAQDRRVAFAFGADSGRLGSVCICRFNESFGAIATIQQLDLDTTFRLDAPLVDILLTERSLSGVNERGELQSFDTRSRQTSKRILLEEIPMRWCSGLLCFADELVVGRARIEPTNELSVVCISSEDHRKMPTASLGRSMASEKLSIGCVGDALYVVNTANAIVSATELQVTVRSDAYRIQQSGKGACRAQAGKDQARNGGDNWLRVWYHVFEKFPVRGLVEQPAGEVAEFLCKVWLAVTPGGGAQTDLSASNVEAVCTKYFRNVMADLRRLNKPLFGLDLERNVNCRTSSSNTLEARSIRTVVMAIVSFLPIQICRAEDNMLKLLQDGEGIASTQTEDAMSDTSDAAGTDAAGIAQSIRFGLLSPILESWSGRCAVATSMGKQSTGKSYFLNHLTGTSFAISGSRCTDGAWMSVRLLSPDLLLVVLDFEGLGSFERSEQEDIFLSVLNSSISLFTVFRMESRFDKDIDGLFSRFQKGVQLIKDDARLFRGLLYMSVKDVNMNDRGGVMDELAGKLRPIFEANRDQNFLTEMYAGQLQISCSPPFGTLDYYQYMENDAAEAFRAIVTLSEQTPRGFTSGKAFLDCIRIVLAKISILDWTSMDKSTKNLVIADAEQKLPGIIRTGCHVSPSLVSDEVIPSHLKETVTTGRQKVVVSLAQVCQRHPSVADQWRELNQLDPLDTFPDELFDVGFDPTKHVKANAATVEKMLAGLFRQLLSFQDRDDGSSKLYAEDYGRFDAFLGFLLLRRKMKVEQWLREAVDDRWADVRSALEERYLSPLTVFLSRCPNKCASCQLGCMRSATHTVELEHECGTGHSCRGRCEYDGCRSGSNAAEAPACSRAAGHEGKCECEKGEHTCGQLCVLAKAKNCDRSCTKRAGHSDAHRCSVQLHVCGAPCSAATCSATCLLAIDRPHTVHKCAELQCLHPCFMRGCNATCGVKDHFHGQPHESRAFAQESGLAPDLSEDSVELADTHMCLGSHACIEMCSLDGICEQKVHLKKQPKTYRGARGSFDYVFQEMNGCKKKCAVVVPAGSGAHNGDHSCVGIVTDDDSDNTVIHYCEARCRGCNYYCNKAFGHMGLHATSHGNMQQTLFVAKGSDIDLDDRKYQVGDRGVAEMCDLFCAKLGRGHVHYYPCSSQNGNDCAYTGDPSSDKRRHCVDELYPAPEKPMDELLHSQFWATIGWEDPCPEEERALFAKCAFQCNAPEHEQEGKAPSYCVLDAWHPPELKPAESVAGGDGFAYVDGHKFECVHAVDAGKFHNVFVLDSSGSMSGQPWRDLLGACNEFVLNRLDGGGGDDLVSFITFDNRSWIQCEGQRLSECQPMTLQYTGGGTQFNEGLRAANEVLSRNQYEEFKAVLIFFSDGNPWDLEQALILAQHIRCSFAKYDLRAFVVGFGRVNDAVLERVAGEMGGEYRQVLDADALQTEFERIAAILRNNGASLAFESMMS